MLEQLKLLATCYRLVIIKLYTSLVVYKLLGRHIRNIASYGLHGTIRDQMSEAVKGLIWPGPLTVDGAPGLCSTKTKHY